MVFLNNETAAVLWVLQVSLMEVELFSDVNTFFCSDKRDHSLLVLINLHRCWPLERKRSIKIRFPIIICSV